jgi:dipeptidyl aminopeptidase/acylaminoacyl peptidase
MDADGNNRSRLTENEGIEDFYPAWSPNGEKIAFTSNRSGTHNIHLMNADGTGLIQLTEESEYASMPVWSPDGTHIVFHAIRDGVFSLYLMESDGSNLRLLASDDASHPSWSIAPLPERYEDVAYAEAFPEQTLTLHLPGSRAPDQPHLFLPYGEYFPDLVAFFTEKGYPILSVSVRNDTFQHELQDTFCALAWVHAQAEDYGLDPARIIPVGGSMGGGNAALLAAMENPDGFLVGCPHPLPEARGIAGIIALAGVFDYSLEDDFFEGFIGNITDFMEGTPEENPDNWAAASAITHINGGEPPFLLLHGTADVNVKEHQSLVFAAALKEAGVEVELELLPGLGHRELTESEAAFERMADFLARFFR